MNLRLLEEEESWETNDSAGNRLYFEKPQHIRIMDMAKLRVPKLAGAVIALRSMFLFTICTVTCPANGAG